MYFNVTSTVTSAPSLDSSPHTKVNSDCSKGTIAVAIAIILAFGGLIAFAVMMKIPVIIATFFLIMPAMIVVASVLSIIERTPPLNRTEARAEAVKSVRKQEEQGMVEKLVQARQQHGLFLQQNWQSIKDHILSVLESVLPLNMNYLSIPRLGYNADSPGALKKVGEAYRPAIPTITEMTHPFMVADYLLGHNADSSPYCVPFFCVKIRPKGDHGGAPKPITTALIYPEFWTSHRSSDLDYQFKWRCASNGLRYPGSTQLVDFTLDSLRLLLAGNHPHYELVR